MTPLASTLSGTLLRHADGWHWSDGTPEPRVHDLRPAGHYNFRIRGRGMGGQFVEVPLGLARENDDLAWVLGRGYAESWDGDVVGPEDRDPLGRVAPGKRAARVLLVPIEQWDHWSDTTIIGAEWDREHEGEILSRARALGWSDA